MKAFVFFWGLNLFVFMPRDTRAQTLNDYERKDLFYHVGTHKPLEKFEYLQIAQKFTAPVQNSMLVQVAVSRHLMVTRDSRIVNFHRTKFRLRIYIINSGTGGPGKDVTPGEIEVKSSSAERIVIDLKRYKIKVPEREFFVAVEYIRDLYNERLTKTTLDGVIPFVSTPSPFRFLSAYQPFVYMSPVKGQAVNTWAMDYSGKWKIYDYFAPDLTDFAISAKVLKE